MRLEDFESVVRVNLTGTFLVCRAVIPHMKEQGRGKIVNIASLGGRTGRPGVGVNYAASKAGVIGLTQTLAREAGPAGVYANAIAPGPILTDLTRQEGPEVFATWNAGRAVGKNGSPEDVAEAALFLASRRSDWITGVTLDINGGILIR
jgi:3-oxoacyl-[acyl-carrier protein] reductase